MNTVVLIPFIICLWLSHCAKENRWPLVLYIFILSNFLKAMNWNHIVLNYLEHGNLFDELSKLGTLCKNTLTKINFVNCTWPIFRLMFGHFLTNSCCPARPLSGGGGGEGGGALWWSLDDGRAATNKQSVSLSSYHHHQHHAISSAIHVCFMDHV